MNYIRIYLRFVIIYMKGKLEYHFSLLLELIANTILIGIYFAGFNVIFYNFNNIVGWNKYEVLFMFTTSWLSYSFSCFFFLESYARYRRTGSQREIRLIFDSSHKSIYIFSFAAIPIYIFTTIIFLYIFLDI